MQKTAGRGVCGRAGVGICRLVSIFAQRDYSPVGRKCLRVGGYRVGKAGGEIGAMRGVCVQLYSRRCSSSREV